MHPLNHVITNVHRISVRRHYFDTKSVLVTYRFKRLIPPACAFDERRTHRFRRAAIDVINDWFNRLAHRGIRILFLQTMTLNVALGNRLANWRGEIHISNADITGARIVDTRLKTVRWQLDQGNMLAHGNGLRHRRNLERERHSSTRPAERAGLYARSGRCSECQAGRDPDRYR